jgi:hypothetical protein
LAGYERLIYDVDASQIEDEPKRAGRKNAD